MFAEKKIQITLDNELAQKIRDDAEVKEIGIDAFFCRALRFYLSQSGKDERKTKRQYKKGYGKSNLTELTREMKDWEDEQVWPDA